MHANYSISGWVGASNNDPAQCPHTRKSGPSGRALPCVCTCVCRVVTGMHGAGLTHALFLRSTSALIELFPRYWSPGEHFAAIASWRRLVYLHWQNNDLTAERPDRRSTVVPPGVVAALVRSAVRRLCPGASPPPGPDDVRSPAAAVPPPRTTTMPRR